MGFIDKLRNETIDIVEWLDDSRHTLVWRFPRHQNEIKQGAQLIVRPGQSAIFVHRGRIADVFGPGQHRLETGNLPVLATLAGWKYGFESPFKAEVYFVSTRQVPDLKWGTPNPVMLRDSDFGPVRVRGFGTYTLRARDARQLLSELVGTDGSFEAEEIQELVRAIVSQAFADVIGKSEIALLDLASHYAQLADEVRRVAESRIDDEYGLEIPQLVLVNVSVPAEVEQALDARTSIGVIGDLGAYQSYQLGRSLPIAGSNPAAALAAAGAGIGLGMAAAGRVAGAPQAAPPPLPAAAWHFVEAGNQIGPLPADALQRSVAEGRVRADTLVWTQGMAEWAPARSVPLLAALFAGPPPIPAPR